MSGGRTAARARLGTYGLLVAAVWMLSSGCLVQVLHLSTAEPQDFSIDHPCGTFKPQSDGEAIIGVAGVTAADITIYAGVIPAPDGGGTVGTTLGIVWADGQGTARSVGSVVADTTYSLIVTSNPSSVEYDTDVATFLVIRDDQGNQVPVDCVN